MSGTLVKIASRPYPLKGVERNTCYIVLLILIAGIFLSFNFHSWVHLERSGSLMVIAGIYLAWKDITGRLDWANSFVKFKIRELKPPGIINSAIASTQNIGNAFQSDVDNSIAILKNRIRSLEAAVLAIGTFIWGYGSVLGNAIYEFV